VPIFIGHGAGKCQPSPQRYGRNGQQTSERPKTDHLIMKFVAHLFAEAIEGLRCDVAGPSHFSGPSARVSAGLISRGLLPTALISDLTESASPPTRRNPH
jgi:hypothetical protein